MSGVIRLQRIVVNTADVERLARFYRDTLGFEDVEAADGDRRLRLGDAQLALRRVEPSASLDGLDAPGWSPWFQHFAIVVDDLAEAMRRLHRSSDWRPITVDGPQRLPAGSGGVTAFKFRDPDGHPLEFLAFPDRAEAAESDARSDAQADALDAKRTPFVRIDHSAISVVDVARGIAFYESLGLHVGSRSLNEGPEQARLDAITDSTVDVVGMQMPRDAGPHVELLAYRGAYLRPTTHLDPGAVAATRLVFVVDPSSATSSPVARLPTVAGTPAWVRDPDGHLLSFEPDTADAPVPGRSATARVAETR